MARQSMFDINPRDYMENPELWEETAPGTAHAYFKEKDSSGVYLMFSDGKTYGYGKNYKQWMELSEDPDLKNAVYKPAYIAYCYSPSKNDLKQEEWKFAPPESQRFYKYPDSDCGVYYREINSEKYFWNRILAMWEKGATYWDDALVIPPLSVEPVVYSKIIFDMNNDQLNDPVFWDHHAPEDALGCFKKNNHNLYTYFKSDDFKTDGEKQKHFFDKNSMKWYKGEDINHHRITWRPDPIKKCDFELNFTNQPKPGWSGWVSTNPKANIWAQCTMLHTKTLYHQCMVTSVTPDMVFAEEHPGGAGSYFFG